MLNHHDKIADVLILLCILSLQAVAQIASTDSITAGDSINQGASIDSAEPQQSAVPSTYQESSTSYAEPPARPFSVFDYGEIITLGVSADYLYYNEEIDISDEIRTFTEYFGRPPQIAGAPKSTEYGFLLGLHLGAKFLSMDNRLWVRPEATALLGFGNDYDGSLQSQLLINGGDTVGFGFEPYKFKKNNFFVHARCDLGYSFPRISFPCALYTGLDFKLWYRDLTDNQGVLYYTSDIANAETYYWLGVPLGIIVTRPVSPALLLGMDACATVMFTGRMNVTMTDIYGTPVNYPAVTLGNRTSVKAELFLQKKLNEQLSVKFAPYFTWYSFGKSNTETSAANQVFFEPASTSFLFGITLAWEMLKKRFY